MSVHHRGGEWGRILYFYEFLKRNSQNSISKFDSQYRPPCVSGMLLASPEEKKFYIFKITKEHFLQKFVTLKMLEQKRQRKENADDVDILIPIPVMKVALHL